MHERSARHWPSFEHATDESQHPLGGEPSMQGMQVVFCVALPIVTSASPQLTVITSSVGASEAPPSPEELPPWPPLEFDGMHAASPTGTQFPSSAGLGLLDEHAAASTATAEAA
jgi:hypothetical protein